MDPQSLPSNCTLSAPTSYSYLKTAMGASHFFYWVPYGILCNEAKHLEHTKISGFLPVRRWKYNSEPQTDHITYKTKSSI